MLYPIIIAAAATVELEPTPISPHDIIAGAPQARGKVLAKSYDRTTWVMAWECTEGTFNWRYSQDETVVIIYGEVLITDEKGQTRRLGPGDMGFFPARSACRWQVTEPVKKVAVLRKDLPLPIGFGVRAWHKLLHATHLRARATPLSPVVS